jgi:EAL domain-containing protein (putative c-di-GMP-specific phosphodiesterase class I)/GGDEF domain-containing protein
MWLTRRGAAFSLAGCAAVVAMAALHAVMLRDHLQSELIRRQQAVAASLAALPVPDASPKAISAALVFASEADGLQVVWRSPDGSPLQAHRVPAAIAAGVPAWFAASFGIDGPAGRASLASEGSAPAGSVEVKLSSAPALRSLWYSTTWLTGLLAAAAMGAGALGWRRQRGLQQALGSAALQAEAVAEGRPDVDFSGGPPELQRLNAAMGSVAHRLHEASVAQAEQVEALQRQAHTDLVTGLPNRRHFIARLDEAVADPAAPGGGLLIVRVVNLDAVNERLGHEAADRALSSLGDLLQSYPQRVPGAFVGRLNGRDVGLYLPVPGVAEETGASLMRALRASPVCAVAGFEPVAGGVDGLHGRGAGPALAAADKALAHAETGGAFTADIHRADDAEADPVGARAWRAQIADALAQGRTQLAEFPVLDARGKLLHLDCPLRVQFEAGGPFRPAARWLALAARGRLLPQVDLAAISLALQGCARDKRPRCVHVASVSLVAPGFVEEAQDLLLRQPDAASMLWIEVAEAAFESLAPALRSAASAWHGCGARLGIEHAGAALEGLANLQQQGVDHIRIAAPFGCGCASDPAVREFARSVVGLVHTLGLTVVAQGIDDADDLTQLWALGFDGATGPAVVPPPAT